MTIEEKAQRYDKTLEQLKGLIEVTREDKCDIAEEDIIDIFPELIESDDEKIRKELIEKVKETPACIGFNDKNAVLAWLEKQGDKDKLIQELGEYKVKYTQEVLSQQLEKQGEPTDINPSEFDLRLNKLLKQFGTLPKEELTSSLSFYLNVVQNDGTYREEKQVEQKSSDKVEPKFKVGDTIKPKDGGHEPWQIMQVDVFDKKYRFKDGYVVHFSQEEDYELIDQKFKVGDWVITPNNATKQIKGVTFGNYCFTDETFYNIIDTDNKGHLWTIQDAKDGDVLQLGKVTAIFKEHISNVSCKCHCSVYKGKFEIPSQNDDDNCYGCHDATPATREQRDTLFEKMKEAGYKWDAESKELKEIEQEPTEWSEEDEYMLNETIQHLEELIRIDKAKHCSCDVQYYQRDIDWLKSIKDRV